jgi:hypothetical protein
VLLNKNILKKSKSASCIEKEKTMKSAVAYLKYEVLSAVKISTDTHDYKKSNWKFSRLYYPLKSHRIFSAIVDCWFYINLLRA